MSDEDGSRSPSGRRYKHVPGEGTFVWDVVEYEERWFLCNVDDFARMTPADHRFIAGLMDDAISA